MTRQRTTRLRTLTIGGVITALLVSGLALAPSATAGASCTTSTGWTNDTGSGQGYGRGTCKGTAPVNLEIWRLHVTCANGVKKTSGWLQVLGKNESNTITLTCGTRVAARSAEVEISS